MEVTWDFTALTVFDVDSLRSKSYCLESHMVRNDASSSKLRVWKENVDELD